MTRDPFDALSLPITPVQPRDAFAAALRRRVRAELIDESEGADFMSTTTAPPRQVDFALHYDDTTAAVGWLVDVLGLTEEWRHPATGPVQHASLRWGTGSVSVNYKHGVYLALGPTFVLLSVDDDGELDAAHARAVAAGADIAVPLGTSWNSARSFIVRDPEGHLWQLSAPQSL